MHKETVFKNIDILISFFLSDLLYRGYSLKYIKEWLNLNYYNNPSFYSDIEANKIDSYIDKLAEFKFEYKKFIIIKKISIAKMEKFQQIKEYLSNHYQFVDETIKFSKNNDWIRDENYIYLQVPIDAFDVYKAINDANRSIELLINSYKLLPSNYAQIKSDIFCGVINGLEIELIDSRSEQNIRLIDYVDKRQKEFVETFFDLKFGSEKIIDDGLRTIERVLHTIQNARNLDNQNRFLNYWSSLEYLLYVFHKKSIIEKVRTIVPKSLSLYYIKDKMNIFWERFINHKVKKLEKLRIEDISDFYEECKKRDTSEYDTFKLAEYIMNSKKVKRLYNALQTHIVLQRELSELNYLLSNKEGLLKEIEFYSNSIICDLDFIYRCRNMIIHSSSNIENYLDFISLRLYSYLNSIISTILYYKGKCIETTIEDVLHSINNTYEQHILLIKDEPFKEVYELIRPQFIYVER